MRNNSTHRIRPKRVGQSREVRVEIRGADEPVIFSTNANFSLTFSHEIMERCSKVEKSCGVYAVSDQGSVVELMCQNSFENCRLTNE